MPPRIIDVLARLRQDVAACLAPEAIRSACRDERHRWRERRLGPVATVYLFLLQVLHGNTACQHVVHFGRWAATAGAYCQARKRLPLGVIHRLLEAVAASVRGSTAGAARWLGHRVWVVDGSSFSMPDTPALQAAFGQPAGQRPGCGFPVAKWLALFDVATGMLLRSAASPLRSHEAAGVVGVAAELETGDVVLGDRGFCSYAAHRPRPSAAACTPCSGPTRSRSSTSRRGAPPRRLGTGPTRAGCRTRGGCSPTARPTRSSPWPRPKGRPAWMAEEDFAKRLPGEVLVPRAALPGRRPGLPDGRRSRW